MNMIESTGVLRLCPATNWSKLTMTHVINYYQWGGVHVITEI